MSLVSHFHTSRYISWVPEAAVQLSEKAAKVRMSGDPDIPDDPDYRMLRKQQRQQHNGIEITIRATWS